ncbi:hypothetical protein GW17_00037279 [Ensete ventricosum]|nr:hypothetical protein GW17_00037279 [Ensete ventricosum]
MTSQTWLGKPCRITISPTGRASVLSGKAQFGPVSNVEDNNTTSRAVDSSTNQSQRRRCSQEEPWLAQCLKPENCLPGMIVGFLLGLFLDLSATRRVSDPRGKSSSSPGKHRSMSAAASSSSSGGTSEELKMVQFFSLAEVLEKSVMLLDLLPNYRIPSYTCFPYRSVPAGMSGTYRSIRLRYVDCPLPDGTAKIDHRRSIEGEKEKKKKKRKRSKKKEEEKKKVHLAPSSPARRRRPRPWVAREPSPPSLVIFLPRGEKDRGDIAPFFYFF